MTIKNTILRLTREGSNLKDNITYNELLELETALNQAQAQMPEGYDEQDDEAKAQWRELIGRGRLYSCFIGEITRRKEETTPSQPLTRTYSNSSEEIIEEIAQVRRQSDPERSQHCRHCITLLTKIEELERRLAVLENQQQNGLIAQIQYKN